MKKIITRPFLSLVALTCIAVNASIAQITVTIQPNAATGKDVCIDSYYPTSPNPGVNEFNAHSWTHDGYPEDERGLVDFDLSVIPAGAVIQSAYLTLYNNPNSANGFQNGQHSHYSGSNASVLQRIITPWSENTCTWSNQPSYTSLNEVVLPADTNPNQDYTVNVLALIQDMRANPASSFGFMLKQQIETPYRCLLFASSDHPDAAKHPKLVLTYVMPCANTLIIQPDAATGKDVCIDSYYPTSPNPGVNEFNAHSWTHNGDREDERGLVDFDLSAIPAGAVIQSAYLTLYNNPNSANGFQNGQHSHYSGSNASVLQRIITPWSENTCTWSNQPSYTSVNEVVLPADTNPNQDYTVNVVTLIQDMIANPASSFGFMLKQQNETPYRCLLFASSDHPDAARHPKLVITYVTYLTPSVTPGGTVTVCSGTSTTLSATAGTGYTYQWYRNNVVLSAATAATFTTSTAGTYKCVVSSGSCTTTTNSVVVSVTNNPTPAVSYSTPLSFCSPGSVLLSGNSYAGVSYQWENNSVAIGGATAQSYTATTAGQYRVKQTANGCVKYSGKVTVSTATTPTATITASGSTTLCTAGTVAMSVSSPVPGYTYQWKKNNVNIAGATGTGYGATSTGNYTVAATASCGTGISNAIAVNIGSFTAQVIPSGTATLCTGSSLMLSANTGTGFTYQWKNNNVNISGATGSTYSVTTAGSYTVFMTSPCGNATSAATVVTQSTVTASVTPAGSSTVCSGSSITLTANAGTGYTYRWYRNNVLLAPTTQTFTTSTAGSYKVEVSISGSCATQSNTAVITVINNATPTVTAGGPTTFCAGQSVTFTANTYAGVTQQWQKNSVNIAGATNQTYTATTGGNYRVQQTANGCTKNSAQNAVTVNCRVGQNGEELSSDETGTATQMNVYPNPFEDKLNIEIISEQIETVEIKVIDVLGKVQYMQTITTNTTTELNTQLPAGIYMVTTTIDGKTKVMRVIKTK